MLAVAVSAGGCNILAYPLYLLAPEVPAEKVPSEFEGLRDKSVAVVVYADMEILYDYPQVREEVGLAVNHELRENVPGVRPVHPLRVVRYQEGRPGWDSMELGELATALEADYVLYVSLKELAAGGADGGLGLTKARLSAAASLHEARAAALGRDTCRWRKDDLCVEAGGAELGSGAAALRQAAIRRFAAELVCFFHDHRATAT